MASTSCAPRSCSITSSSKPPEPLLWVVAIPVAPSRWLTASSSFSPSQSHTGRPRSMASMHPREMPHHPAGGCRVDPLPGCGVTVPLLERLPPDPVFITFVPDGLHEQLLLLINPVIGADLDPVGGDGFRAGQESFGQRPEPVPGRGCAGAPRRCTTGSAGWWWPVRQGCVEPVGQPQAERVENVLLVSRRAGSRVAGQQRHAAAGFPVDGQTGRGILVERATSLDVGAPKTGLPPLLLQGAVHPIQ